MESHDNGQAERPEVLRGGIRRLLCALLTMWLLCVCIGCSGGSMVMKGQVESLQQQQASLLNTNRELTRKANALNEDNADLHSLLSIARQETRAAEQQAETLRNQLENQQEVIADLRTQLSDVDEKTKALVASHQRRGGITITPNNSFLEKLPEIKLAGVEVIADDNVVRVRIAEALLFRPNTTMPTAEAQHTMRTVAQAVFAMYPDQRLGVEGHVDSSGVPSPWWSAQHLSAMQATAAFDLLMKERLFQPKQVHVTGHGAAHPVERSADGGQDEVGDHRIEIVIYPDRFEA